MFQDDTLLFLQHKIHEIKTAVFKAEINTELKLPNNIVSTIKTDDEGNVWFLHPAMALMPKILTAIFLFISIIIKRVTTAGCS